MLIYNIMRNRKLLTYLFVIFFVPKALALGGIPKKNVNDCLAML